MSFKIAGLGAAVLANVALASSGGMPNLIIPDARPAAANNVKPNISIDSENRIFTDAFDR